MLEFIRAGGWLMIPIIGFSIVALAICLERLWALNQKRLAPEGLLRDTWRDLSAGAMTRESLDKLRTNSALGMILAAGIQNANAGRDIMKESIEEAASYVIHDMERYLNTLGTIASVAPLLGLLGTVIGMITVFAELMQHGTGNVAILAGGISQALITTATGITVAIPALIMHRYFHRKIDGIVLSLEQQAVKLVDAFHGQQARKQEQD